MNNNQELFEFIKKSPSAYHTVDTVKKTLISEGYSELSFSEDWNIEEGGKYFVEKNGTSIIAFRGKRQGRGFMITASHSDSPAFRVKINPESKTCYTRLETEKYGGMIHYTWLDRPLSVAGRAVVKTEGGIETRLVDFERAIAVIPSVAIHLNRGVNDGYKFNPATDLQPLLAGCESKSFISELAELINAPESDILSHDLFLYNNDEGKTVGLNREFILSPRLDDLECVYASLKAFVEAEDSESVPVLAVFDNEEVGSETKQGAASTFLGDTLMQIGGENYLKMLECSFMVSADNAHACHPNHPELSDKNNAPVMNEGIVVKWNASQRYATDAISDAIFREISRRAGAKLQSYYNRADMLGGSTLGSISDTRVSIPTVDIGLPQLAMHSANETAGARDLAEMIKALREFYKTSIRKDGGKILF